MNNSTATEGLLPAPRADTAAEVATLYRMFQEHPAPWLLHERVYAAVVRGANDLADRFADMERAFEDALWAFGRYAGQELHRAGFTGDLEKDKLMLVEWLRGIVEPPLADLDERVRELRKWMPDLLPTPSRDVIKGACHRAMPSLHGFFRRRKGGRTLLTPETLEVPGQALFRGRDDEKWLVAGRSIKDHHRRVKYLDPTSLPRKEVLGHSAPLAEPEGRLQSEAAELAEMAESLEVREALQRACDARGRLPLQRKDARALRAVRERLFDLLMSRALGKRYERYITHAQVAAEAGVKRPAISKHFLAERQAVEAAIRGSR